MMKLFISTLMMFSVLINSAENTISTDVPAELKESAKAVVKDLQAELNVKDPGSSKYTFKTTITIYHPDKNHLSQIYLTTDKFRKLKKLKGTIYDSFGNVIKKIDNDDIIKGNESFGDAGFSDVIFHTASLSFDQYPFTIEYEYEIHTSGILYYPTWNPYFEEEISIIKASLSVQMPSNLDLHYKKHIISEEPVVNTNASFTSYQWSIKNKKAIPKESFSGYYGQNIPKIILAPSIFEIDGNKGSNKSWQEFGQFYYDLNENLDNLATDAANKVNEIVKRNPSKIDQIKDIYQYLQDNMRYVSIQLGIGGFKSISAEEVYKNKSGDCKALVNYMYAMLKQAGIKSYPALVYGSKNNYLFHEDFPSNQFNHVILFIPLENDTLWLECTSNNAPFGYLGSFTSNRNALIIEDGNSRLINTPVDTPIKNQRTSSTAFYLSENGTAEFSSTVSLSGNQQEDIRSIYFYGKKHEIDKYFAHVLKLPNYHLNAAPIISVEKSTDKVKFTMEGTSIKLASITKNRIFLSPLNIWHWDFIPEDLIKRESEIFLNVNFEDIDTIWYTIPDGYIIEAMPEFDNISNSFGEYSVSGQFVADQNKILFIRKMLLHNKKLHADQYSNFRDYFLNISKADKQQIVLVKN